MSTAKEITVLVAEDHNVMREALCSLLNTDTRFRVVGEAEDGRAAVQMALAHSPDVILMDLSMPLLNGIEATRQILSSNPSARIVILSAHYDDECVNKLFELGVLAFLQKDTSAKILIQALRRAAVGETFVGPSTRKTCHENKRHTRRPDGSCKAEETPLTARESEVLQLVAEGFANKQSAAELHVSIKTVEKHRQSLMDKLDIHDTAGLTRYAIAMGAIDVCARLTVN